MNRAKIIDGKAIAETIRAEIAAEVSALSVKPGLAVIMVGDDPASAVYVRNKQRACRQAGMVSENYSLPENSTTDEVIALINQLNASETIHGILVQLPLPAHLDEERIVAAVSPEKDVDGFAMENIGRLSSGNPRFASCTPMGVMELLHRTGINPAGKECVVVGRSNIVGKPMAMLLLNADATVTVCHSKTADLAAVCRRADILIAAVGRPEFIAGDMIKDGAVVIDVGTNRTEDGRLVGDVNFEAAADRADWITPVPGGVGPMTIAMLLRNTLLAAKQKMGM